MKKKLEMTLMSKTQLNEQHFRLLCLFLRITHGQNVIAFQKKTLFDKLMKTDLEI